MAQIKKGSRVMLRYTGMLPSGKVFDSNMPRGTPLSFNCGSGDVIRGMDMGVIGMRKGGRRRIIIPPAQGYGAAGTL
jgi:FKBP-type peptidyl-prolyl cis-trans isomerase